MLPSYSHSSLASFRNCPRQFKFKYVERVDIPKRVHADTYLGNAVHRALKELYAHGADGVVYPLDDIVAFYTAEWEKVDRQTLTLASDYYTMDDYIRIGREMLVRHYQKYRPFNQGILLGAEMRQVFVLGGTSFRIKAIIDRLWKRNDGTVEICDYKTGRQMARPHDPDFFYQMGLYELAVKANYPQFDKVELVQYYLRKDETVSHRMAPEELEQVAEELRTAIVQTLNAERLDDFPPKESNLCNYCDYVALCPAKRHGLMLEAVESAGHEGTLSPEQVREKAEEFIRLDQEGKEIKEQKEALRSDLIEIARQMGLTKLVGGTGDVSVSLKQEDKFVGKTDDAAAFAELSYLVRQMGMDDYFLLDAAGFMKDIYSKKRLTDQQTEQLRRFVTQNETARVAARPYQQQEGDE